LQLARPVLPRPGRAFCCHEIVIPTPCNRDGCSPVGGSTSMNFRSARVFKSGRQRLIEWGRRCSLIGGPCQPLPIACLKQNDGWPGKNGQPSRAFLRHIYRAAAKDGSTWSGRLLVAFWVWRFVSVGEFFRKKSARGRARQWRRNTELSSLAVMAISWTALICCVRTRQMQGSAPSNLWTARQSNCGKARARSNGSNRINERLSGVARKTAQGGATPARGLQPRSRISCTCPSIPMTKAW